MLNRITILILSIFVFGCSQEDVSEKKNQRVII